MSGVWKVLWLGLIVIVPGGLVLLAVYALTRAVVDAWHRAQVTAPTRGVSWKDVLAELRFKDTLRQVRTSFGVA